MVLCNIDSLKQVSKYLQCTQGKLSIDSDGNIILSNGSEKVVGFGCAVISLAKGSKFPQLGTTPEEEALVYQWIEYATCYANYCETAAVARQVLKEINAALASSTYFVNNAITVADVVMYSVLYNVIMGLSFQDKEKYMHLSRWFDNIQQESKLRQKNKLVAFSRTQLYA